MQAKVSQANAGVPNRSAEEQEQAAVYELEYIWDEQGLIDAMTRASRLLYTTRLGWSAGRIICTLAGVFLCFIGIIIFILTVTGIDGFDEPLMLLSETVCLGLGYCFLEGLIITFTSRAKKQYRRQIDNCAISRDLLRAQALRFKEDKITVLQRLDSSDCTCDKVYRVKHDADGMYIFLKIKRFLVIPNSAFRSEDQKREIASFIENRIKK